MSTATFPSELLPGDLRERLSRGEPIELIDVREYPEFAAGRIDAARLLPLSELERRAGELSRDRDVVLMCRSGRRSAEAEAKLRALGFTRLSQLKGGFAAWQEAGLPVTADTRAPWALERQVRLAAGALVLLGLIGAQFWAPAIALSWFVSCGLIFAAITDTCAMGMLIARLPWNRPRQAGACGGTASAHVKPRS